MSMRSLMFSIFLVICSHGTAVAETVLVMVEEQGCVWCARWDKEISHIYPKTKVGKAAPLKRIDIHAARPENMTFTRSLHFTPTFVLMIDGKEASRLEGYPGEDFFWGLVEKMLAQANIDVTGWELYMQSNITAFAAQPPKITEKNMGLPVFDTNMCTEDMDKMASNAMEASNFLKAISHEGRLMILCHLASGEKSVTELETLLSVRQAAVSQQLSRLRLEGLVTPRRDGKTIYYRLTDDRPKQIMEVVYDLFCRDKWTVLVDCRERWRISRKNILLLEIVSEPVLVALFGLFGGILLGLAARIGRFCTLGAIEDLYYGENTLRLHMWGVAIGVSVIGTFGLSWFELFDLQQSLYLSRDWNPLESIIGGLVFGYGMALAGNCGYGALARAGGGDLRSLLIVLIMGISAYVTLGGPLSGLRIWFFGGSDPSPSSLTFAHSLSQLAGVSIEVAGIFLGCIILLATLLNLGLRRSRNHIFWGAVAGLAIVTGWAGTQWVASNGFDATPVVSHTFSAPIGETILYFMTSSGNSISFGTGSVFGVLIGAFLGCLYKGHFRWEACDDARELRRQILGAVLMGIGAVLAVGCSVGQGLSAFSVLAYSAPITLLCVMFGAAIGLRQLIVGFAPPN